MMNFYSLHIVVADIRYLSFFSRFQLLGFSCNNNQRPTTLQGIYGGPGFRLIDDDEVDQRALPQLDDPAMPQANNEHLGKKTGPPSHASSTSPRKHCSNRMVMDKPLNSRWTATSRLTLSVQRPPTPP